MVTQCMKNLTRITLDPTIMGGKPCIRGLRVTVGTIIGLLASGISIDGVLEMYPYLQQEDVMEALAYAAWRSRVRILPLNWSVPDNAKRRTHKPAFTKSLFTTHYLTFRSPFIVAAICKALWAFTMPPVFESEVNATLSVWLHGLSTMVPVSGVADCKIACFNCFALRLG